MLPLYTSTSLLSLQGSEVALGDVCLTNDFCPDSVYPHLLSRNALAGARRRQCSTSSGFSWEAQLSVQSRQQSTVPPIAVASIFCPVLLPAVHHILVCYRRLLSLPILPSNCCYALL